MKNGITIVLFFLIPYVYAQHAVVSGKITNAKSKEASIQYYENFLDYDQKIIRFTLAKNGTFSISVPLPYAMEMEFSHGDETTNLFLEEGDSVYLTIDTKQFDETIKYKGKGSGNCNYLAKKYLNFENSLESEAFKADYFSQYAKRTPVSYLNYVDSIQAFYKEFFANNKAGLSERFLKYEYARITYKFADDKMNYPAFRAYLNKEETYSLPLDTYYNFLDSLEMNNDDFINNSNYGSFLSSYLYYKNELLTKHSSEEFIERRLKFYKLAELIFKGISLEFVRAKICFDALSNDKFSVAEPLCLAFKNEYPHSIYTPVIEARYSKAKRTAIGQPAPNFMLTNIEGNKVSLSDFKGKVVYMDVWASWCGPCLEEIPSAKKLKEHFAGKDVVFLYVSIDTDANAWKKRVKERQINGVHLLSPGFKGEIGELYGINGVPKYMLIDKNGLIADDAPPRPSGENVIDVIQEVLDR